ncbi:MULTISPECIES: GNAT family N-acetyltransferase [Aerosakkonema]|uniref:GNAT family N-acetyltransferase n=1 Tax=Aerosakkonema TaxID=1246629 RepID=UPI0035B72F3A
MKNLTKNQPFCRLVEVVQFDNNETHSLTNSFSSDGLPSSINKTERLAMRLFKSNDYEALSKIYSDEEVMRYIGAGARTEEQTRELLESYITHWQKYNFGPFAILLEGELIGRAGLYYHFDSSPDVQIGYVLARKVWGNGYGTEVAAACLKYGFEALNFNKIGACVRVENKRSSNILDKLGMRKQFEFCYLPTQYQFAYYCVSKSDYSAQIMLVSS